MGSARKFIKFGGGNVSKFITSLHEMHYFFESCHFFFGKAINVNAGSNAFSNFKIFVGRFDQIIDTFVINFNVAHRNAILSL